MISGGVKVVLFMNLWNNMSLLCTHLEEREGIWREESREQQLEVHLWLHIFKAKYCTFSKVAELEEEQGGAHTVEQ